MRPRRNAVIISRGLLAAVVCVLVGASGTALALQSALSESTLAGSLISQRLWFDIVHALGATPAQAADGRWIASLDVLPLLAPSLLTGLIAWFAGAAVIARRREWPFAEALAQWGLRGWAFWLLPGAWELLRVLCALGPMSGLESLLVSVAPFVFAAALGAWLAGFFALMHRPTLHPASTSSWKVPAAVWIAAGLYTVVFTAMNWQLYRGLLVPHGDSAMYEEHLWNLTHGKGFRSYLDQGLFLGEHLQVAHVLLVPLHVLWPSHLLLELCQSLALASGAIAVYWISQRHTQSRQAGVLMSIGYLLYVPMQFLDIAIDLKTFRPDALGIPALLFAIDQFERRRFAVSGLLLLVALSAQESYAMVLAPLGLWMALHRRSASTTHHVPRTTDKTRSFGAAVAIFSAAYLLLAVTVTIPWFRSGVDVHYSQYFGELGNSPRELLESIVQHPGLVAEKLLGPRTLYYLLALLVPLGLVPLFSPGRLAVAVPMFAVLSLMELAPEPGQQQLLIPFHHFHAPLVPIVVWAAAAGLGHLSRRTTTGFWCAWGRHAVWCGGLATGLFFSLSPLGVSFWDRGSAYFWKSLYVPGERAELFPRIYAQIPLDSRVASTDLVHTRFTHHERSYDYSAYPRAVNDGKPGAPPDADYIVIDVHGRYNDIRSPAQIREYREHPDQWEVLPDATGGYFIVLRRKW